MTVWPSIYRTAREPAAKGGSPHPFAESAWDPAPPEGRRARPCLRESTEVAQPLGREFCMRSLISVAVAVALLGGMAVGAEDPPEGSIGVQVKIEEGKIVIVEPVKGGPAEKA